MRVRLVYGRPRSTGRDRICGRLLAVLARDVLTPDAASGDVRNNAGRPPWYNNIRCLGLLFGDAEVTITTELPRAEITVVTLQFRLPNGREAQLLGTELAVVELRKSQAGARLDRCSPLRSTAMRLIYLARSKVVYEVPPEAAVGLTEVICWPATLYVRFSVVPARLG